MEVAGLYMPILSVFAPLLKSRFFGFYVNGVTLADKTGQRPYGWLESVWLYIEIGGGICYNTSAKERISYDQSVIRLPREDLSQARHTKLYKAIPPFATGLPHLYYSLTTLQNNHILPQHDTK